MTLEPVGDNQFVVSHVFEEATGAFGIHPNWAADTDCDGLDELATLFYPVPSKSWRWDSTLHQFVESCSWEYNSNGALVSWFMADLDQDGASEWVTINHERLLRAHANSDCTGCDGTGQCTPPERCLCQCLADPQCDSDVDVLDVVAAVNTAFRSGNPLPDPFPDCAHDRTDADCSGVTDILDVVRFVNVAFRNEPPATQFCDPCAP